MKKLTTYAYAAIAALGLTAPITANAAPEGYVDAGTDVVTYQMLYDAAGGSNDAKKFSVGPTEGLLGTFAASQLWFENGKIFAYNSGDYILINAPEGTFIDSIEAMDHNGGGNGIIEVYQSTTPPTFDNYTSIIYECYSNPSYNLTQASPKCTFTTDLGNAIISYGNTSVGCTGYKVTYKKQGGASGGMTDHINVENLKAANPDGKFAASSYMDRDNLNEELTMTGASGAEYKLTQVIANDTWWCNDWNYPSPQGECYNTSSENYIKSITLDFDYVPGNFQIYVSNEPITGDNKYSAEQKYLYKNYDTGKFDTWEADGIYKYFYIGTAQERITDIAIEYTSEKPEITATAPEISCYDDKVNPESNISVRCGDGYKLNVKVYHNDILDEELSKDDAGTYYSFKAGGKAGETLKVEAFSYAPDYIDSEVVTRTWEISAPPAATPTLEGDFNYDVVPGTNVVLSSETENATISYSIQYEDWSTWPPADPVFVTSGSGASPLTVTVPADAPVGLQFNIKATAIAEGFSTSSELDYSYTIVSDVLPAPEFSVEDKAEVIKGSSVEIKKNSYHANAIHYIVNGGEVQVSAENVKVAVNEDATIEAWLSGEDPFKDSEHITLNVFVEKFTDTQHVLVPETFTTDTDKLADTSRNEYTATVNGISYTYSGGMENFHNWNTDEDQNVFYMVPSGESNPSVIYNTTPVEKGINAFKITNTSNYNAVYVAVSDEPITEITDELKGWDEPTAANIFRMRIGDPRQTTVVSEYNKWVKVSDFIKTTASDEPGISPLDDGETLKQFVPKYFAFYAFGTGTNRIARVIVDVTDPSTVGVAGVESEGLGNIEIYDLNGVRVDGDNLAPGVYIRKANGKAQKFLVK